MLTNFPMYISLMIEGVVLVSDILVVSTSGLNGG